MHRRSFLAHTALAAGPGSVGRAWAQSSSDERVKARLTLNLLRFTVWPATVLGPTDTVVLAVATRNADRARAFAELEGQTAGSRALRVVLNPSTLPRQCHALFVDSDSEKAAQGLMVAASGNSVLTIGDTSSFIEQGMVCLVNINDAIRLDVHLGRLRAAQLSLSSQVLRLARVVRE